MMNCNLATTENVSLDHNKCAGQLCDWSQRVAATFKKFDKRLQKFFNAQAGVRGTKPSKPEFAWSREDGFC